MREMAMVPEVRGLVMMCSAATEDALVDFVERHADTISMFRVTAPVSVLDRIGHLLGDNLQFAVGTAQNYMGGDAQVATQVVLHDVGAALIFRDPIGASGAAADCDALLRLINVHNIMNATNPSTAEMLVEVLRDGMTTNQGVIDVMPSFYKSLESPSVAAYKAKQNAVIASHGGTVPSAAQVTPAESAEPAKTEVADADEDLHRARVDSLMQSDKLQIFADRGKLTEESTQVRAASAQASTKSASVSRSRSVKFAWESFDFAEVSAARLSKRESMLSLSKRESMLSDSEVSSLLPEQTLVSEASKRFQFALTEPSSKYNIKEQKKANMAKLRVVARTIGALHPHLAEVERHKSQAKEMRCLALISHNNMKGAMKEFVLKHQEVLKRFRLTGTNSTMTMLKSVLGEKDVVYGPTCSSGPLGGDAEVGALMCVEDLGGMIFFTDPLDPHPHAADIVALIRMADLHNVVHASNPSTGDALVRVLKEGLTDPERIPTFFTTNLSPAIEWHNHKWGGAMYKPSGPLSCFFESGPLSCFFPH